MGGGICGLLCLREGTENFYYVYDGNGNVTAVVDSEQETVAQYAYDEYGNVMDETGTLNQPYRFSTKRYDADLGLYYYGYRFYSPALGRWLTRDPLGESGGINLYAFVLNNPVNWVDPWGLFDEYTTGAFLFGIATIVAAPDSAPIAVTAGIGMVVVQTIGIVNTWMNTEEMLKKRIAKPIDDALTELENRNKGEVCP